MGEGGGVLVLEELEHALERGAHIYGEFVGYGMTGDASHLTEPVETGEPAGLAMTRALARRRASSPSEVDYINAHGTSTPLGDAMETKAIKLALGDHACKVMVSSSKSMFGHCLGAAGALEAAATVLSMEAGKVPPTINLEMPDPAVRSGLRAQRGPGRRGERGHVEQLRLRRPQRRDSPAEVRLSAWLSM